MYHVLKSGGLLIVCCPSENYDADKIIEEIVDATLVFTKDKEKGKRDSF